MNAKHILCYGDSNTWGYCASTGGRYADDVRWPMQLQKNLGAEYYVQESGLSGRTTVFEDPLHEGMSALTHLLPAMSAHCPLDLMVIMLGTNDTKERFAANGRNITDGMRRLLLKAKSLTELWQGGVPNILLVAPIIIDKRLYTLEVIGEGMGAGSVEKSETLPRLYEGLAKELGCAYMDCNPYVTPADGDFMHFDLESNTRFANALTEKIRSLFA